MKDKNKILGHLFAKWRKQNKISLYRIAKDISKEEGEELRPETLARIEKGEGVISSNLIQYIHYCYVHGFSVMDVFLQGITQNLPFSQYYKSLSYDNASNIKDDKPSDGRSEGTLEGRADKMMNTDENEESKGVCNTSDSASKQQPETPQDSSATTPLSDDSQYKNLYHSNTSVGTVNTTFDNGEIDADNDGAETTKTSSAEEEKGEKKGVCETTDNTSKHTSETIPGSSINDPKSDESQFKDLYHNDTSDSNYVDTSSKTSDQAEASTSDTAEIETKIENEQVVTSESTKDSEVPREVPPSGAVEVTDKSVYDDLDNMSPEQQKQYDKYIEALHMQECGDPIDEEHQLAMISFMHICPMCGGHLVIRKNRQSNTKFIGCENWLPEKKGCNYTANGNFDNPELKDDFLPKLTPNLKLNPGLQN